MRRSLPFLGLLGLLACDAYDGAGVQVSPPCEEAQRVESLRPGDGVDAASPGGPIVARIACAEPEATLRLVGPDGDVDGAQQVARAGRQIRFHPDAPLPASPHEARLDTPGGHREWTFTPLALAPVGDVGSRGLALRFGDATVLDPAGVDEALESELLALRIALVIDGDPESVRLGGWRGDPADGTVDTDAAVFEADCTWDDPALTCPLGTFARSVGDADFVLHDAVLSGSLTADGGAGFVLTGRWAAGDATFADVCAASEADAGPACGACHDGGSGCIEFHVVHVPAAPWGGTL